jgi:hypothetical protein
MTSPSTTPPDELTAETLAELKTLCGAVAAMGGPVWGPTMQGGIRLIGLDPAALLPKLLQAAERAAELESKLSVYADVIAEYDEKWGLKP